MRFAIPGRTAAGSNTDTQAGKRAPGRSRKGALYVAVGLLLIAMVIAVASMQETTSTQKPSGPNGRIKTIFLIMMENTDWSQVKGNPSYAYLNETLLPDSAFANNYVGGIGHPSLPNYVALEAGAPMGLTDGAYLPPAHSTNTTEHLTTQLRAAGVSWKYYAEDLPGDGTRCNTADPGTPYSLDHNPFVYFDDIRTDSGYCQAHERPYRELIGDLRSNTVPNYNFIVPNDWDQGEKLAPGSHCMSCQADQFLKSEVPIIQASTAYHDGGAIIILWDESGNTGNHPSGMIINSPLAKKNYSNNVAYNHGSTLRTMQNLFGVRPFLRAAASATDFADFFTVPLSNPITESTQTPSPSSTGSTLHPAEQSSESLSRRFPEGL